MLQCSLKLCRDARVFKPLRYEAKPPGAVHDGFNASGEDGLKGLRNLTFLLEKNKRKK